uniref:GG20748 n=1 Tax=Drosophila erecta TaxID=7220 RepID=B3P0T3_DROER
MHRRCIICGQEPGEHCVYPRNMSEARRWQNLANLSSFDVDPESLCRHGCVCASHLDSHGYGSESESSCSAAGRARAPAGLQNWSSSVSDAGRGYLINKKGIERAQNQSKHSLGSERQEFSSANRCTNGYCRFRNTCNTFRSMELKTPADDFRTTPCSLNYPVSPTSRGNNRFTNSIKQQTTSQKPELKSECCQACITQHLKDQEVQCSTVTLQTQSSSPVSRPRMAASFSHQTGSSATGFSAGYTTNSSNFTCGGGERRTSNAINVLLMNGTRNNDYEDSCCSPAKQRPMAPPPEICVQESDLTECNERAVFPEIDKPNYRVCRSSNETNVLVLEEGPLDKCNTIAGEDANTVDSKTQSHSDAQQNPNTSKEQQNNSHTNWLESAATNNFTKVLELQRSRIKELENLLEQHSLLQQTIQHKVAELQCTDIPDPKNKTKS